MGISPIGGQYIFKFDSMHAMIFDLNSMLEILIEFTNGAFIMSKLT